MSKTFTRLLFNYNGLVHYTHAPHEMHNGLVQCVATITCLRKPPNIIHTKSDRVCLLFQITFIMFFKLHFYNFITISKQLLLQKNSLTILERIQMSNNFLSPQTPYITVTSPSAHRLAK